MGGYIWGIVWSREELSSLTSALVTEVAIYDSEDDARDVWESRDDKYWPSMLVKAPIDAWEVVEPGAKPEWL